MMRILPFLAAVAAMAMGACDAGSSPPPAKTLLAVILFHVDPVHPSPNAKMPDNLRIEQTSYCSYLVEFDDHNTRYSATMAFSPTATVRFQHDSVSYWQHIDGAKVGVLDLLSLPEKRLFSQKYGLTYDDLMHNRFSDDGIQPTVTEAMRVFRDNYCSRPIS